MKRPEYVAVVTDIYARLIRERRRPTPAEAQALELAFSRSGFTEDYWLGRHGPAMFGIRPENTPEPKELFAAARARCEKDDARTVPVHFSCILAADTPASLTVSDGDGHTVTVSGPTPEPAQNKALTAAEVSARLQKTAGHRLRCADCAAQGRGRSVPLRRALNALRRDALLRAGGGPLRRAAPPGAAGAAFAGPGLRRPLPGPDGLRRLMGTGRSAAAPFPRTALRPPRNSGGADGPPRLFRGMVRHFPRVWRDSDEPQLCAWLAHAKAMGVTAALAGNLGHLPLLRDSGLTVSGDFGLNVFNSHALDYLRRKNLAAACLSFELRFPQMRDMQKVIPAEAIVYGRLPL